MSLFERLFKSKEKSVNATSINADTEPDNPCLFGYKTAWYAIKGETPETVIEKLRLSLVCKSNWNFGVKYANDYNNRNGELIHHSKMQIMRSQSALFVIASGWSYKGYLSP